MAGGRQADSLLQCRHVICTGRLSHHAGCCTVSVLPMLQVMLCLILSQILHPGAGVKRPCLRCATLLQANRGGQASTSAPTAVQATAHSNGSGQSANGNSASATLDGVDPAWLQLPVIHYALLQGNQQPSFRLATGQHDTRHWLAWEVWLVIRCAPLLPRMTPVCHVESKTIS